MTDFSQYAAVPGTTEFMPDFFLDDFDEYYEGKRKVVDRWDYIFIQKSSIKDAIFWD